MKKARWKKKERTNERLASTIDEFYALNSF